jgi:uncharacterized RDD family membrane protein YckC
VNEYNYAGLWITVARGIVRYLGYYVSAIPLLLGFVWVAFDERKQGLHDKLAGTFVVRDTASGPAGNN